jgi:ABC-type sugar transport system permease subunit
MKTLIASVKRFSPNRWRWWRRWGEETFSAYLFILPSLAIFIVFTFFPAIFSIVVSFFRWNMPAKAVFIGVQNYVMLTHGYDRGPGFWKAILNTGYFALGVPINLIVSLVIALLLNRKMPGVGIFRTTFFLPTITSLAAVSVVWLWLYHPSQYGLFNSLLIGLGLPLQRWLRDPLLSMPCLILMGVWHGMGYNIIIFLAGLQSIPRVYLRSGRNRRRQSVAIVPFYYPASIGADCLLHPHRWLHQLAKSFYRNRHDDPGRPITNYHYPGLLSLPTGF